MSQDKQPYIASFSIHGLVRSQNIEFGESPDTGGQVSYVLDQAAAAGRAGAKVDVFTRLITDPKVSEDYSVEIEEIPGSNGNARIVRLPFGPSDNYLPKEQLWEHLPELEANAAAFFEQNGEAPDVLHGHYADAGQVTANLSNQLSIPMVFTGHSMGHSKFERLFKGEQQDHPEKTFSEIAFELENQYRLQSKRIPGEEIAIEGAETVFTSTLQEAEDQYTPYQNQPKAFKVIAPGVDFSKFTPPAGGYGSGYNPEERSPLDDLVDAQLDEPEKPIILTVARPEKRKNLIGLIEAYAASPALQEKGNLVIIAGEYDLDSEDPEQAPNEVQQEILDAIEAHGLQGKVALPNKQNKATNDVPRMYQRAAAQGGIFVNSAFTEPFGLTALEAMASGLPVALTDDGGPRSILNECDAGLLVNVFDQEQFIYAMESMFANPDRQHRWAKHAPRDAKENYDWDAHVERYLEHIQANVIVQAQEIERQQSSMFDMGSEAEAIPVPVEAFADETRVAALDNLNG